MAAGVTVTVRAVPEPPNAIPELGTSVVSEELPDKPRLLAGVSASLMVNGSALVLVSSLIVAEEIDEIVGGVLRMA